MSQYYGEICDYNTKPWKTERWFDVEEKSNCIKCAEFFRKKPVGKVRHKLWLSPRGSTKSTIMAAEVKRRIQLDPLETFAYFCQSEDKLIDMPTWIIERLVYEAERAGWENPKVNGKWGPKKFTVNRPKIGAGLDPTLRAYSVEKPGTGIHWGIAALDDVVGDYSNRSAHMRRKTIEWFRRMWAQKTNKSEIWIVGTLWPGFNLYRWIMDNLHEYFDVEILGTHYEDTGEMTYPWYTDDYLREERKGMTEAEYAAQFLNQIRSDDELVFTPEHVEIQAPGSMALNHFLLMDLGTSVKEHRHSSKTAMFLAGVGHANTAWLFDGFTSKGTIMDSGDRMLGILRRAQKVGRYPLGYTVEKTGPAVSAWPYFDKIIEEAGLPHIPKIFLSRNTSEKDARIERIQPFVNQHRLFVMPGNPDDPDAGFPTGVFRKDETGMAFGTLAESMRLYTRKNNDESWDDLDALADLATTDTVGNFRLPRPAADAEPEKPETDYDRAYRQSIERGNDETIWLK